MFSVCFPASCCRSSEHSCRERGPAKLLPWEPRSASQHQVVIALNCVCEHLCVISIYFVHPLAKCVLRYNSFFALHYFGLQKVSKRCILTTGLPGKSPVPFLKVSFFINWITMVTLLETNWLYKCGSISGLSILFPVSLDLSFYQDHLVLFVLV